MSQFLLHDEEKVIYLYYVKGHKGKRTEELKKNEPTVYFAQFVLGAVFPLYR